MKPLIFFFWFFLITMNLMAKKSLISEIDKSPFIFESGCYYIVFKLPMKSDVRETRLSSSQIICINNNQSHVVIHMPHSYIKGYKIRQGNVSSCTDADKYIVLTNWKSNIFNVNFLGETLFYGKAPPDDRYTEVKIPGQVVGKNKVGRTSVSTIIEK